MTLWQFGQNIMTRRSNPKQSRNENVQTENNHAMKTWTYTSWYIREYC